MVGEERKNAAWAGGGRRRKEEEGGRVKKVGESVQKIANKKYFAPPTAREKELRKRGYR